MKYEELKILEKAELLDKLVNHAKHFEDNFIVILNPDKKKIQEVRNHVNYFLKILNVELNKKALTQEQEKKDE